MTFFVGFAGRIISLFVMLASCTPHFFSLFLHFLLDTLISMLYLVYNTNTQQERRQTMADHNQYDKLVDVWEKTKTFDCLRRKYRKEIEETFVWANIEASMEVYQEADDFEEAIDACLVGSVFTIFPSGKYYMPWAHSNVSAKEALLDEVYREVLEDVLDQKGMFLLYGDGDPTDVFFARSL